MKKFEEVKDKLDQAALGWAVDFGRVPHTPGESDSGFPVTYGERLDCVRRIVTPHSLVYCVIRFGYRPSEGHDLIEAEYAAVQKPIMKAGGIIAYESGMYGRSRRVLGDAEIDVYQTWMISSLEQMKLFFQLLEDEKLRKFVDLRKSREREVTSLSLEQLMKIGAVQDIERFASPEGEKHVLYPAGCGPDHLGYYRDFPESSKRRQEFTLQKAQELLRGGSK